jgi:hypothetical protein
MEEEQKLQILALFNTSILLWTISVWLIGLLHNDPNVIWIIRSSFAWTSLSVASFVVFVRYYIHKKFDPLSKAFSLLTIFSIINAFYKQMVVSVSISDTSPYVPVEFGPFAIFFILFVVGGILIILYTIIKYKKSTKGLESLRLGYLSTGVVLGGLIALTTNLIFPLITGSSDTTIWDQLHLVV